MATFRYTLNGTVLTDEPLGWLDTEETLRREETFFSLINEVQGSIDFVKQGTVSTQSYNIITTAIDANPFQDLTFLVERENTSGIFETEFDGLLPLVGIIHDEIDNFYRGAIVINDVGAQIQKNLEAPYYFTQGRGIDGSTTITDAFTNRKITTLEDPEALLASNTSIPTYPIDVALQGLLDYTTNAGITLDSDLFETDSQQTVIRTLEYTGLVTGEVLTISFTFFSGPDVFTHTYTATAGGELAYNDALNNFLKVKTSANVPETATENKNIDITYLAASIIIPTSTPTDPDIRFASVNNFTIDSATASIAGTSVITTVQEATYGMVNLAFATGNNLKEAAGVDSIPPTISLSTILKALNNALHISFRIIKTGGTQTFKIERFEDFFESTSSLTVNRVQNLTKELISDFNISTIIPGDGHTPTLSDEVHQQATYKSQDVDTIELDIQNTFIVDTQTAWLAAETGTDNAGLEDFYFLMITDNTASPNIVEKLDYGDGTSNTYFVYNAYLSNFQMVRSHFFALADNIGNGDTGVDSNGDQRTILITNTKPRDFIYRTTFDVEISFVNFQSMKNGQTEKILYNTDGLTNSEGWIFEVGYNKRTGLAKFILLTEN